MKDISSIEGQAANLFIHLKKPQGSHIPTWVTAIPAAGEDALC